MKTASSLGFPALLLLLAACGQSAAAPPRTEATAGEVRITGPYTHENLAVFLIHRKNVEDRNYLTLDEGLKEGSIEITEKQDEQVNELQIENKSGRPLFIQEGDRLKGGKQDRICGTTLIIPARSGRRPVPSFCIERSRWREGATGKVFVSTRNSAVAPKKVRLAAKCAKDQGEVWEKVAEEKATAAQTFHAPNTNSSLNETLDSEQGVEISQSCLDAVGGVADRHSDVVGVAIVINGSIEEINLYPTPALLKKVYRRLIESYALQAASQKKNAPPPTSFEIAAYMKEEKGSIREEKVDDDNLLQLVDGDKTVYCETKYEGRAVHRQWWSKTAPSPGEEKNRPPQEQEER